MAKLYFHYAAMNAGKSTIMLQASYNYRERGLNTLLLKPVIDTRSAEPSEVKSRIGLSSEAQLFSDRTDLKRLVLEHAEAQVIDCVLIDEAQFLTAAQVWELSELADIHAIPVMAYGLRTDFQGKLFPGSAVLLAIADNLREIRTICWCGRKATMVLRTDADGTAVREGAQVEIGNNDRYVSLCRQHWRDGIARRPV